MRSVARSQQPLPTVFSAAAILLIVFSGCGYFNALYNAQQKYDEAQRAEVLGNRSAAIVAYDAAIARAAVSYQKYSKSRWADDALLLIGKSHFGRATNSRQMQADSQAVAAFTRLLEQTQDRGVRTQAFAYLGAARTRLGSGDAVAPLDSAALLADKGSDFAVFIHLWRARARFAAGDTAGAWGDLGNIPNGADGLRGEAQLERLTRAVTARDSMHWRVAMNDITGRTGVASQADSVLVLFNESVDVWGAGRVRSAIPPDAGSTLNEADRLRVALMRAELAAMSGDTAAAITDGLHVGTASSLDISSQARVRAAKWMLATAGEEQDLTRIRATLVPAISSGEAVQMIQQIRILDVLIGRASSNPIAMFVAAEYARDELRAPSIARVLFLRADSLTARTFWNGKALLAAMDLSRNDAQRRQIESRMSRLNDDVYVRAARGVGVESSAFIDAEQRVRQESAALRAEASVIARAGDVSITRAVALRDSVRLVLFNDSLQRHCLGVLDSLRTKGIRGDSARAACVRVDTVRFNAVMKMDSAQLKKLKPDTLLFTYLPPRPRR